MNNYVSSVISSGFNSLYSIVYPVNSVVAGNNPIYAVPLFPQDIWNEILSKSHLHLVTLSCVTHSLNELTKTYAEKITPEGCFGIEKWKKYKVDADAKSVPKIPLKML